MLLCAHVYPLTADIAEAERGLSSTLPYSPTVLCARDPGDATESDVRPEGVYWNWKHRDTFSSSLALI